jgi:hypothetical protein
MLHPNAGVRPFYDIEIKVGPNLGEFEADVTP